MSDELTVALGEQTRRLGVDDRVLFGRDPSCELCLDPSDRGISRIAGEVRWETGTWWVINRSAKRVLHVVDETGMSVPLPVGRDGWPAPRRAITSPGLTVLVPGEVWTHELRFTTMSIPTSTVRAPISDPETTKSQLTGLTDNRREALIALLVGYLRPFPRYDPRPLSYAEAGELLSLPASTVRKRIEAVRTELADRGVSGLDGDDAPRRLAEWMLSTRTIIPADVEWLERRLASRTDP
jgi:hypothetical protein